MNDLLRVLLLLVSCVFTQNFVLVRMLGSDALLRKAGKLSAAAAIGLYTTLVMTVSAALNWLAYRLVLAPLCAQSLYLVVFALIIVAVSLLVNCILSKWNAAFAEALKDCFPLLGAGTIVLGVAVLNLECGFGWALLNGLFGGIGLLVALVLMSGIQERLKFSRIPASMKGLPISLVAASLMAIAFMGFTGMGR